MYYLLGIIKKGKYPTLISKSNVLFHRINLRIIKTPTHKKLKKKHLALRSSILWYSSSIIYIEPSKYKNHNPKSSLIRKFATKLNKVTPILKYTQ